MNKPKAAKCTDCGYAGMVIDNRDDPQAGYNRPYWYTPSICEYCAEDYDYYLGLGCKDWLFDYYGEGLHARLTLEQLIMKAYGKPVKPRDL